MLVDKEIEKLEELQLELKAMVELDSDEDLLKKQIIKVNRQRDKVDKLIESDSNEEK